MPRFLFELYENEESRHEKNRRVRYLRVGSAELAVRLCLDPTCGWNYLVVFLYQNGRQFDEFVPSLYWNSFEHFQELLNTHIRASKIQLGLDLETDRAAEDLIIAVLDKKRHGSKRT